MTMTASDAQDPLEELQRENDVIVSLLTRILESAGLLKCGKDVPPGEISEELRLLDQYLGVHGQRLDQDLMPYARGVAMPGCFPHLDRILQDHEEAKARTREARKELESYEQGSEGARTRLVEVLEALATRDHEVTVYEGDYPLSCLVTALPEELAQRVAERFVETQPKVEDLESHIHRLLAAPPGQPGSDLRVHCAQEGCSATGTARIVPGHEGRLGLRAPSGGWSMVSQDAQRRGLGAVRIKVDFFCASHGNHPQATPPEAGGLAVWADEGGRPRPRPSGPAVTTGVAS